MRNCSAESERELLPLSWLAQYGYCPRRCALLALDQVWNENEFTAEGRAQHQRVHTARVERRGAQIFLYEQPVFSRTLGVSGLCDCVMCAAFRYCFTLFTILISFYPYMSARLKDGTFCRHIGKTFLQG